MINRRHFIAATAATLASPAAFALDRPQPDALFSLLDLPAIDGDSIRAKELTGRPVLVTFWASWCPPCRSEFRHLNKVQALYGPRGLLVVGVNAFEDFGGLSSPEKRDRFLSQTAPDFRLVEGDKGTLAAFGGVDRIPTVLLFDREGDVSYRFVHEKDARQTHTTFGDLKPPLDALFPV